MVKLYLPKRDDLDFRRRFLADEETMSYNHAWGGTIAFPEEDWDSWYEHWLIHPEGKRFYRYLQKEDGVFVGEVAFHYDEERRIHIADIIVYAPFRHQGYGKSGLSLLMEAAKESGVKVLYDDIAIDNPAKALFEQAGFQEEYRTAEIIMLKKEL